MSHRPATGHAWLEGTKGNIIPVEGILSIGRDANNSLVLSTVGVSRCHATIQAQAEGEYWLADYSRNGTWVNDHRILQPVRLKSGDRISILKERFVFRQFAADFAERLSDVSAEGTICVQDTRELPFWLLITDIVNYAVLSRTVSGQELAERVGNWLQQCRNVVDKNGGRINKYLGDGFFAVWPDTENSEQQVCDAVRGLAEIREKGDPPFRLVVHRGVVAVGGSPLLAEESFIGAEVNFTFRMEKLAGSLGLSQLFSEPAAAKLSRFLELRSVADQQLKGFEAKYTFFTPA